MPRVVIHTGVMGADGQEETLAEYMCDSPGCPNYAEQVIAFVRELGIGLAVCHEHAAKSEGRQQS
jgi:hypothetical protein